MSGQRPGVAELLLVRHGESQGNVAATLAQQAGAHVIDVPARDADVELSGTGREQALALGGLLAGFPDGRRAAVWSSPVSAGAADGGTRRARPEAGRRPVLLDERLRDRELGILDMLTSAGVEARLPEEAGAAALARQVLLPAARAASRGRTWCSACAPCSPTWTARIPAQRVLLVCHDAVILLIRYILEGLTERNCWTSPPRPPSSMPP